MGTVNVITSLNYCSTENCLEILYDVYVVSEAVIIKMYSAEMDDLRIIYLQF